ncbi:tellurite resistance/C4-dicarboxylate transporter family protein [Pseudonocardia sp. RS11V-5]|uniref:tellurite resistance/C4-dicarboxylate transporter family protein n=1 Tax=Pseudonocardia terrae TaxID=2905831 RepID=UPI001E5A59E4|nr:tellurite resistance/C4-dicarboxylate transporter family protein [Pseudonocardia terrae]MCE3553571.1 tellurite resistance/C4-dicarboxylate transporter family protein [Pseudonocardia terrae]
MNTTSGRRVCARRKAASLASFFPGYFALVMATGIIAIGCRLVGIPVLDLLLYAIAGVGYVVIAGCTLARLFGYPRLLLADLTDHAKGFAFTTAVAASEVLGSASAILLGWWTPALVLWWIGLALWAVLLYTTLIAVVLRVDKPDFGAGINGTWFLLTVATESLVVLGALLLPRLGGEPLAFACLAFFCLGIVLYLIVMTMVFLRWTFARIGPNEEDPPTWIAAGAVAIIVLAGSNLLLARTADPRIDRLAPVLELLVVLAWATATFWFPLMVAIGVWRHVVNRIPLRYHPSYWALVFPLGMYAVATFRMRLAIGLDLLGWLPAVVLTLALVGWAATFTGLTHRGVLLIVHVFTGGEAGHGEDEDPDRKLGPGSPGD